MEPDTSGIGASDANANDRPNEGRGPAADPGAAAAAAADTTVPDDPNSSLRLAFTTPSKSLPPLKDIDRIDTPKAFAVAPDASSPILTRLADTSADLSGWPPADKRAVAAGFLGVSPADIAGFDDAMVETLAGKSARAAELDSQVQFLQLAQEQAAQEHGSEVAALASKLEAETRKFDDLQRRHESLEAASSVDGSETARLAAELAAAQTDLEQAQRRVQTLEAESYERAARHEQETLSFTRQLTQLTKDNVDAATATNDLTKQVNALKNETFTVKFDLTKAANEAAHYKKEKTWFETEWRAVQDRLADVSHQFHAQRTAAATQIADLTAQLGLANDANAQLKTAVATHEATIESQLGRIAAADTKHLAAVSRLEKEIQARDESVEILQVQADDKSARIAQLEDFVAELRAKSSDAVQALEAGLSQKQDQLLVVEERLKRAEDALEDELRSETDLPRLTQSAELVAANASGISLSALYSEYSHLKKQLALERSQKDKLAQQLELFVNELESRKPTILSYKDQIAFYESSMKEMVGKIESVRFEKVDSDKKVNRLKTQLVEIEDELAAMKQLCKDLGKQICYYLIHSKVRDDNDDPLSAAERKAIDNIIERTGQNDNIKETDTDMLISERLVSFASIVELQHKNGELLTVIRQLGKKLELQDNDSNKELESAAIEEAKEAILTLQGELDSLSTRYEAVIKERDSLKSSGRGSSSHLDGEIKYLTDANTDLRKRLVESEEKLDKVRSEHDDKIKALKEKLSEVVSKRDEMTLSVTSAKHNVDLLETKYQNSQLSLRAAKEELTRVSENSTFWKEHASKQESLLVGKSTELKQLENKLTQQIATINTLQGENRLLQSLNESVQSDNVSLKSDKTQLNEFVMNLQNLLKERQTQNSELTQRLDQSIQNYQSLQERLNEREEKIQILANQSELAYKAQNSKLEQVNELSHVLMETKNKLESKTQQVSILEKRVKELTEGLAKSDTHIKALKLNPNAGHKSSVSEALSSETQRTSEELHLAEIQIAELSNIAKSAEDTLVNVTNSFEDYRQETEKIQSELKAERQKLQESVKQLQEETDKLRTELNETESKHSLDLHELNLKLQASESKLNSVDDLQKEYESKLSGVKDELNVYVQLAEENRKKYAVEQQKSEDYAKELTNIRSQNETLQGTLAGLQNDLKSAQIALDSSSTAVSEERAVIGQELESTKAKLQDLEDQNKILLNQLELLKVPSGSSGDASDLQEVVAYLRKEKDSSDAKAVTLEGEVSRLQLRLESTVAELETTKNKLIGSSSSAIEVEKANREHQQLLEQIQEISVLRDSNKLLRSENETYLKQLQGFEVQIGSLQHKIDASETELGHIRSSIDEKNQEISLLKEENQKLFSNASDAVGSTSDEDKQKLAELQARFDRLRNESQTKLSSARAKEREFQKVVDTLNAEVAKLKADIEELKASHGAEVAELKKPVGGEDKKQIESLEEEKRALEGEVKKLQQINAVTTKAQNASLEKEVNKVKQSFNAERQKLQAEFDAKLKEVSVQEPQDVSDAVKEWESKYAQLEKTLEASKAQLISDYETKLQAQKDANPEAKSHEDQIAALKQEFAAQLEKEKQQARTQTEKKFEIKIRMLNKKIDKLKPEASDAASTDKKRPASSEPQPSPKKTKES